MKKGEGSAKREREEEEEKKEVEEEQEFVGRFEFYSAGGWHEFSSEQSAALEEKLRKGLIAEEERGIKKKSSEKRIRRERAEFDLPRIQRHLFVIVPNKHWPKPARCTCCEDGIPTR